MSTARVPCRRSIVVRSLIRPRSIPLFEYVSTGGLASVNGERLSRAYWAERMAVTRRWILAAAILGSSMAFIDGTVVNVALPAIQSAFGATLSQVQWVVEAFALCLAAFLLTGGSLGDLYGR